MVCCSCNGSCPVQLKPSICSSHGVGIVRRPSLTAVSRERCISGLIAHPPLLLPSRPSRHRGVLMLFCLRCPWCRLSALRSSSPCPSLGLLSVAFLTSPQFSCALFPPCTTILCTLATQERGDFVHPCSEMGKSPIQISLTSLFFRIWGAHCWCAQSRNTLGRLSIQLCLPESVWPPTLASSLFLSVRGSLTRAQPSFRGDRRVGVTSVSAARSSAALSSSGETSEISAGVPSLKVGFGIQGAVRIHALPRKKPKRGKQKVPA